MKSKKTKREEARADFSVSAGGKSSKDMTHSELVAVYQSSIPTKETAEERLDRINAFRCGW